MSTPDRHNMPWSPAEESVLLVLARERKSYGEIANLMQRSFGAVKARLADLACRFVDSGESVKQAAYLTHMRPENVEHALKLREIAHELEVELKPKKTAYKLQVLTEAKKRLAAEEAAKMGREFETNVREAMTQLRGLTQREAWM